MVSEYAKVLDKTKTEIKNIVWNIVDSSVNEHIMESIPDKLDMLSSHTYIEGVHINELEDLNTSSLSLTLTGNGTAEVELTYGGKVDHVSMSTSYPLSFEVQIDPLTFSVVVTELDINTDSFYE